MWKQPPISRATTASDIIVGTLGDTCATTNLPGRKQQLRLPNSIDTIKAVKGRTGYAGRGWLYDYRQIPAMFSETSAKKKINKILQGWAKVTQNWDDDANTIWVIRLFMAAKLLLMATLNINSLRFAESVNLRAAVPHLKYYSLLSLARALCLTIPEIDWADGQLVQMSHKRAITDAVAHVRAFDNGIASELYSCITVARAQREFIDYRAPSSGDGGFDGLVKLEAFCRLLAELTQMNSELLEISFEKHTSDKIFDLKEDVISEFITIELEGVVFVDWEDFSRLGYLIRKHPRPASIRALLTEGWVDEFFGSWLSEGDGESGFNPDENPQVIFDIFG